MAKKHKFNTIDVPKKRTVHKQKASLHVINYVNYIYFALAYKRSQKDTPNGLRPCLAHRLHNTEITK